MRNFFWVQIVVLIATSKAYAQNCSTSNYEYVSFPEDQQIVISACVEKEVGLGKQSVYWRAENLSGKKSK